MNTYFSRTKLARVAVFVSLFLAACDEPPAPVSATSHFRMTDDTVVNYNRKMVKSEGQEIEDFIARYRWNMDQSTTGLRLMIYKKGNGLRPVKGSRVVVRYDLKLLTGEPVYSSDSAGPREFEIGTGSVENGFEEGVLQMRAGDRAKMIVPSHLAFGLLGDLKKIPERAVLVYDIELVQVKVQKIRQKRQIKPAR